MKDVLGRAEELSEDLIAVRRKIHANPETGFELTETLKLVTEQLASMGIIPERVGKAGLVLSLGKQGGKTFLLRADMDALPMKEETGLPFASQNGSMHACGHDIHTTALLGAVRILKEREDELAGQVKVVFQPAEERMTGAQDMVEAGLLSEKPDAAMALHVVHGPSGTAGYALGNACGSSDLFKIRIIGKGGHGAAPHMNIDPIHAASHLVLALEGINSREVHPASMLVLTVCMIHGGTAPNIMPGEVVLEGSIRTMDNEVRAFAKQRLEEISKGVAATFRAECEVTYENKGIPPMVNDPGLTRELAGYIDGLLGPGTSYEMEPMTGSEDFSVISQEVPSSLFWFGTGDEKEGYDYGVHDPRVTFNEESIHKMSAVYAQAAMEWLKNHAGQ